MGRPRKVQESPPLDYVEEDRFDFSGVADKPALLRDEGMTLVRVADGVPGELGWERCDLQAQRAVEQRLLDVNFRQGRNMCFNASRTSEGAGVPDPEVQAKLATLEKAEKKALSEKPRVAKIIARLELEAMQSRLERMEEEDESDEDLMEF